MMHMVERSKRKETKVDCWLPVLMNDSLKKKSDDDFSHGKIFQFDAVMKEF